MITYNIRMDRGIVGGKVPKFNDELITHGQKKKMYMPGGYFPAVLNKTYLENDFAKFRDSYVWNPDPDRWSRTVQAFENIFKFNMAAPDMSVDDAIAKMELSASPGFPWNEKYPTKRDALKPQSEGGSLELIKEIIQKLIATGEIDYEFNGKRYNDVFFKTSPKSEIRPIEKINHEDPSQRKTRTFMCGDLIMHIVGFMLYKNQNDAELKHANSNTWSAVGVNPFYGGWDRLSRTLLRNEPEKIISMDVKHMEASVCKVIQTVIYELRRKAIKPTYHTEAEINRLHDWYFDNVTDSLIIDVDGFLCQKHGKNPSGQVNTLTDNTKALIIVLLYAVSRYVLTVVEIILSYEEIAAKVLGDDSTVENDWRLRTVMEDAKDLGFTMTLESEPGPLDTQTFLSSQFYFHPERRMWIQKPNFEKILANVLYNFKKSSWRYSYVKLCAARKLVYAFPEWRCIIDEYIEYIHKYKLQVMERENEFDDELDLHSTRSQLMADSQNDFLIFGDESVPIEGKFVSKQEKSTPKLPPSLNKLYNRQRRKTQRLVRSGCTLGDKFVARCTGKRFYYHWVDLCDLQEHPDVSHINEIAKFRNPYDLTNNQYSDNYMDWTDRDPDLLDYLICPDMLLEMYIYN